MLRFIRGNTRVLRLQTIPFTHQNSISQQQIPQVRLRITRRTVQPCKACYNVTTFSSPRLLRYPTEH